MLRFCYSNEKSEISRNMWIFCWIDIGASMNVLTNFFIMCSNICFLASALLISAVQSKEFFWLYVFSRQAQELTERTSADQAAAIKIPLTAVNKRWDDLLRGIVERQRQLENALLRLGQFQHALSELLIWIKKTDNTLDELKPVAGDAQILEIELAKLKVLVNDIQAHQTSIDTLNDAGRQIIESGEGELTKFFWSHQISPW